MKEGSLDVDVAVICLGGIAAGSTSLRKCCDVESRDHTPFVSGHVYAIGRPSMALPFGNIFALAMRESEWNQKSERNINSQIS
jgi:hypothetical protein